jgi:hypothetical protein
MATHAIRLVESSPGAYFVSYDGELILESRHPLNEAAGYLLKRKFAKPRDCLPAHRSDGELVMGGQVAWLAGEENASRSATSPDLLFGNA